MTIRGEVERCFLRRFVPPTEGERTRERKKDRKLGSMSWTGAEGASEESSRSAVGAGRTGGTRLSSNLDSGSLVGTVPSSPARDEQYAALKKAHCCCVVAEVMVLPISIRS